MPDAVSGTSATAYVPASTTVERKDQGSQKDMFLKLLVAQMKYQDPSNPASSNELMAQNATFTQVEKLEEIAKQNASLLALQRSSSAGALVGRTVSYTDENGAKQSGLVTSVRLGTDTTEATAMVGGVAVAMGRITEVASTAASTTPRTGTPAASA
jgi:flagellar basal-body rod modification protein FlgD